MPAVLAAIALHAPPVAQAAPGSYTVLGCKTASGAPNTAPGWVGAVAFTGQATNACSSGGSLAAVLPGTPSGGTSAAFRFAAPSGTRIVRLRADRTTTGIVKGTKSNDLSYLLSSDGRTLERCDVSDTSPCTTDLTGIVDKEGLDGGDVQFRVTCQGGGDETCTNQLRLDVRSVAVGLADAVAPAVGDVRVADDGASSGILRVLFDAADGGGGVYRALTLVDGVVKAVQPLGGAACTDAAPEDGDPYQFVEPRPCAPRVDEAAVAVDVRTLSPGAHAVEIRVEDAAGNVATAHTTQFPRVNAEGATLGSTAAEVLQGRVTARFVKTRTQRYTSRFGERVVVRGELRSTAGRPIVGSRIDVVHILPDGRRLVKTGLKTRGQGRFTLILPMNVRSRRVELAFRAVRPGPITSRRTLRLTVLRAPR